MTATITPVGAWCPVDEAGALQVQHIQFWKHDIMVPPGKSWRVVRVVVDPMETWGERDEAAKAIDALPDAVACAMLGSQSDPWAEEAL